MAAHELYRKYVLAYIPVQNLHLHLLMDPLVLTIGIYSVLFIKLQKVIFITGFSLMSSYYASKYTRNLLLACSGTATRLNKYKLLVNEFNSDFCWPANCQFASSRGWCILAITFGIIDSCMLQFYWLVPLEQHVGIMILCW